MNVDWDLLSRYLANTCDDEDRQRFEQWLAEAPEHRVVLQGTKDMLVQAQYEVAPARAAELLASLRRDMSVSKASGAPRPALRVIRDAARPVVVFPFSARRSVWSTWVKVAAAVLLLVGGTIWVTLPWGAPLLGTFFGSSYRDVVTARGQRIAFQLSDGTAVMLAPGSRLRIPRDYGVRARTVSLFGEGAFTVTHDATRPFSVQTARGVAKDLGTQFIVREYDDDTVTEVVVAEGEVELRGQLDSSREGASLRRGQLGRLDANGKIFVQADVDLIRYLAWTKGQLVFRDTPLREAVAQLTRWYDVQIRLEPEAIGRRPLTASAQDESAKDVLRMVATSLDLELETSDAGRIYTLRAR